nr:elongation factor 1-beta 1 [Ipomoea batatas]GMC77909.1 elongation factor 1-beta 1 [Ipomoea batatas]
MVRTAAAGLQPPRPSPLAAGHRGASFISDRRRWPSPLKVYAAVLEQPSAYLFPNASKWYHDVSTKLAASFPGKAVGVRIGCQDAPTEAAPAKVVAANDAQKSHSEADSKNRLASTG